MFSIGGSFSKSAATGEEYGSFMKQEELFGGRPVYYNEMYKMFMLYVEALQEWKLSYQKDDKQPWVSIWPNV